MKVIENTTRYQCDFCNREYRHPRWVAPHELRCAKNPDNQHACFGCIYLQQVTETKIHEAIINMAGTVGEIESKVKTFRCNAIDSDNTLSNDMRLELYSYKAPQSMHARGWLEDAERMPNTCEMRSGEKE